MKPGETKRLSLTLVRSLRQYFELLALAEKYDATVDDIHGVIEKDYPLPVWIKHNPETDFNALRLKQITAHSSSG